MKTYRVIGLGLAAGLALASANANSQIKNAPAGTMAKADQNLVNDGHTSIFVLNLVQTGPSVPIDSPSASLLADLGYDHARASGRIVWCLGSGPSAAPACPC